MLALVLALVRRVLALGRVCVRAAGGGGGGCGGAAVVVASCGRDVLGDEPVSIR